MQETEWFPAHNFIYVNQQLKTTAFSFIKLLQFN